MITGSIELGYFKMILKWSHFIRSTAICVARIFFLFVESQSADRRLSSESRNFKFGPI